MGYGVYDDQNPELPSRTRFAGYMVPAYCDFKGCSEKINRGLGFKCEEHFGEDDADAVDSGCNYYFCEMHRYITEEHVPENIERSAEHPEWMAWLIHHSSWTEWRADHPDVVKEFTEALADQKLDSMKIFLEQGGEDD